MKRTISLLFFCLISVPLIAQEKWMPYTSYQLFSYTRHAFDGEYLILDDYSSHRIEESPFNKSFTVGLLFPGLLFKDNSNVFQESFNFGLGVRRTLNTHLYLTAETNLFYKSSPLVQYGCIDIPLHIGWIVNPSSLFKFKLEAGVDTEIGKWGLKPIASVLSWLNSNLQHTPTDLTQYSRHHLRTVALYTHLGAGIEFYNYSLNVRIEQSQSSLTSHPTPYNANLTETLSYRVIFVIPIPTVRINLRRTTKQIERYE